MVKKEAIDIFAIARKGEFAAVRENDVVVEFPPAAESFVRIMENPQNADRMSSILSQCFGREVHYKPTLQPVEQRRTQAGDLSPIYDAFGRENVQVIDE